MFYILDTDTCSYTLCRHKLNFLNALALTLSRRERGL
jgi:hypothetical protein